MDPNEAVARLLKNQADAFLRVAENEPSTQFYLPGRFDPRRTMPNHLARSSLFAPIARGTEARHRDSPIVTRSDAAMIHTGIQHDEPSCDILMELIHQAKAYPLGEPVPICRAHILRSTNRGTSKSEYSWLDRTINAFCAGELVIETTSDGKPKMQVGTKRPLRLLDAFEYDEARKTYIIRLDPRWRHLYANNEFAFIDWSKRMQIRRGQDMAKALQRLVATSDDSNQYFRLEWLKDKMQYRSPIRKFKVSLISAMKELERVEVITAGRIGVSSRGIEQAILTRIE